MELDADLAEALWVLRQPRGRFDMQAMERDTLASLERIPNAKACVLDLVGETEREVLDECMELVRRHLSPEEAYIDVPGLDPRAG